MAEQQVDVEGGVFSPTTILTGDWERVVWRWAPEETHGLVANDTGETWCEPNVDGCSHLFEKPGEYRYHCIVHPTMSGVVLVERRGGDPGGGVHAIFFTRMRGLTVEFDASAVAQARVAIESYEWDLGDGATGVGRIVEHAYATPGSYLVRLTVVDEFSNEARESRVIDVIPNGDPLAVFRVNASGRSVLFDTDPREGDHVWDLGDGNDTHALTLFTTPTSVVHVYLRGGEYPVVHTYLAPEGERHSSRVLVRVDAEETFSLENDGLSLEADASALPHYANATYAWLFGDLDRDQGMRVNHTFREAGRWSVELQLRDDVGDQSLVREVLLARALATVEPFVHAGVVEEAAHETPFFVPVMVFLVLGGAAFFGPERYK
jgi:hypothetical protein